MAKGENSKTVEERIAALETEIKELKKRGGGMLSSADFRTRIVHKERKDCDYEKMKKAFLERDWVSVGRRFIIDEFEELNLTPFSYDLSIGDEIFSVRKAHRIRRRLPYDLEPGETIILLTKEFIALPPCYSATVWPRFNLVREGVFQSMVKIDPTWYGQLGVAVSNLSPRIIKLEEDMAFGTLVLYELSNETDIDLWRPKELPSVRVKIPKIPIRDNLQQELQKLKLTNICWVEGEELFVRGLKKSSYKKLCALDSSEPWQKTASEAKDAWLKYKDQDTKRKSIGMEALEMENLEKLVEGPPMGESLYREKVRETEVTSDALCDAAVDHGKPFDLVANIPKMVMETFVGEIAPRIRAEVEASVFPKTVTLTLTVLGFISLIIAITAYLIDKYRQESPLEGIDWPGTVAVIIIVIGITSIIAFLALIFGRRADSWIVSSLRKQRRELQKQIKIRKKAASTIQKELDAQERKLEELRRGKEELNKQK